MSFFPWNKKNKEKNKEKSGNVGKLNKAHFILILDTFCLFRYKDYTCNNIYL